MFSRIIVALSICVSICPQIYALESDFPVMAGIAFVAVPEDALPDVPSAHLPVSEKELPL